MNQNERIAAALALEKHAKTAGNRDDEKWTKLRVRFDEKSFVVAAAIAWSAVEPNILIISGEGYYGRNDRGTFAE